MLWLPACIHIRPGTWRGRACSQDVPRDLGQPLVFSLPQVLNIACRPNTNSGFRAQESLPQGIHIHLEICLLGSLLPGAQAWGIFPLVMELWWHWLQWTAPRKGHPAPRSSPGLSISAAFSVITSRAGEWAEATWKVAAGFPPFHS